MALTRTNRINSASADSFGTGAYTSGSFTPNNSSLLVAVGYGIAETDSGMRGTSLTISDSLGTLTWTARAQTTASPGWSYGISIWTAPVTTGASMTASLDCGATNIHAYRLWIDDITGYDTGTPVTGSIVGSDADGNGTAALTLAATPDAADIIYGAAAMGISSGTPSVTPGSGFTELMDALSTGWANWELETITGVTSTNVDWADLNAGAGTNLGGTLAALIIKNAAGGGGATLAGRLSLLGAGR